MEPENNQSRQNTPPQSSPPIDLELDDESLTENSKKQKTANGASPMKLNPKKWSKKQKIIFWVTLSVLVLLLVGTGIICYFAFIHKSADPESAKADPPDPIYSVLTGEEITDAALNSSPTYCIQTPNGLDGARPQVSLNQAGVVFEAIAEAGITRFAAIYQNPTSSVIGPIRSLRPYYLEWDTPFDCTIVHAGGSSDALTALKAGNYRDLTESTTYMWRDYSAYWAPNNLFTSATLLNAFNSDNGYTSSNAKSFTRMTPDEASAKTLENIAAANPTPAEDGTTPATVPLVTNIAINFSNQPSFNTIYAYNQETNSYLRSYATGDAHLIYSCPSDLGNNPAPQSDCGDAIQVAPKVVIAMFVNETRASDNYYEVIPTTGSGEAIIFQNGEAIKATWAKATVADQIRFSDANNNEIKLGTGQTWIAAVSKNSGSVNY